LLLLLLFGREVYEEQGQKKYFENYKWKELIHTGEGGKPVQNNVRLSNVMPYATVSVSTNLYLITLRCNIPVVLVKSQNYTADA
jgi:hypothetical protein